MNPPNVYDASGRPYEGKDRRQGPGQRASDIERQLVESAITLATRGPKATATLVALGSALGAVITFVLMVFGLRIGGAADLGTLRADVLRRDSATRADALRRDSALEFWRAQTDSVARESALRIANLEEADRFKMFLLCNIAEQVGARSGGICSPNPQPRAKP